MFDELRELLYGDADGLLNLRNGYDVSYSFDSDRFVVFKDGKRVFGSGLPEAVENYLRGNGACT